ncbi:MAG: alpha/beta hydrolase [Candidatus Heimdallarchaeota archaeon]|nr:alpha/beta hydrolase [Candidatus Heimdallarchaeota archaeon]
MVNKERKMTAQQNLQKCNVSGHLIAYHREGSGEAILLVHGITTYSFIWRKLVPLLSANYDVVSIDLLGCGESDKTLDVEYSIKHHSFLIKEFITQLGIKKFHFLGHDVGGGIGQIFAVKNPEYLFDLTLINSVAYDFWPVQPIIAMRTPIIRQMVMATLDLGTFKLIVKRGLYHKNKLTPELMEYFWKPMKTKEGRKSFIHFANCLNNQHLLEIEDELRKLKVPVLIIRGDADPYLSLRISQKLHSEIPGSRLIKIATGSHFIQEDEPEMIVEAVVHFFKEKIHASEL